MSAGSISGTRVCLRERGDQGDLVDAELLISVTTSGCLRSSAISPAFAALALLTKPGVDRDLCERLGTCACTRQDSNL